MEYNTYLFGFTVIMTYLECMTSPLPVNEIYHMRVFPTPSDALLRPNLDTLYSSVLLDLSDKDINMTLPFSTNYYVAPIQDADKDIYSIGWRTTGEGPLRVLISRHITSHTHFDDFDVVVKISSALSFILLRTFVVDGDYPPANHQQNGYIISALPSVRATESESETKSCGLPPGRWNYTDPAKDILDMTAETFYELMMDLLVLNPPDSGVDAEMIEYMKNNFNMTVGDSSWSFTRDIDEYQQQQLIQEQEDGIQTVLNFQLPQTVNGWAFIPLNAAAFGNDYVTRASITFKYPYSNLKEDSVYYDSGVVFGDHSLVFPTSTSLPENNAFWSVTVYDSDGYLYPNEYDKYSINSGSSDLIVAPDGSVSIHFLSSPPTPPSESSNWLPIPTRAEGGYEVYFRVYWPLGEILEGSWSPPRLLPLSLDTDK